ncbi:ribokinase [Klebsiella pneumoniae]|uniref:Ribokinase n=1 Tax=Klebsiella pneumoniae TaxID=573 RepID=A0A378BKB9_KLEPN|nr:ribokinase [Klebsiella pneumoniae]
MATFDAVFVGLTILDIAGRPVVAIPPRGGVAFIEQIRLNPAGTAAGANINAAKLGIRTAAVACLGEDEKADFILASYARLGIDCSLIQRTALKETSATILPIRPNGERPALHCRGASDALFVSEAEFDAVLDCRFLHHGGTGLLAAMDQGQSARLLQAAKARGVTTSFDLIAPNEETLELLRPLLPSVDYFMPSLEEAAFLSGETPAGGHRPLLPGARRGHLHSERRRERLLAYRPRWRAAAYCAVAGRGGGYHRLRRQLLRRVYCRTGARTQRERQRVTSPRRWPRWWRPGWDRMPG